MERNHISGIDPKTGSQITLAGWVQDIRVLKNVSFIVLRDHTGIAQITLKRENLSDYDEIINISRESVITVTGSVVKNSISRTGPEIIARNVRVLNRAESPLPLGVTDPVNSDIDTRLNSRFLDLRKRENSIIFEFESSILWGIRRFLRSERFVEVHTPKVVASATEGGADLFGVKYFEKNAYLNQSPQLYKEILISSGFERVFEVGPAFRAEKHNTPRHLNEFTSIDIEMGFSDHNDAMAMLENSIRSGVEEVLEDMGDHLKAMGYELKIPKTPFPRIGWMECYDLLNSEGNAPEPGSDFSPEQLRIIGDRYDGFFFITGWPEYLRPFYTMPDPENEGFTNSFDLQLKEIEVTSGAQRVHQPDLLEKRFRDKGLKPEDFDFYLNAFRYGMPPHAGWGLGLERLTMILLGLNNIREATLFPRDRTRLSP